MRRHHVFVFERQMSGSMWLVYDANSGRHRHSPQINLRLQDRKPALANGDAMMRRRLRLALAIWAGFGLVCLLGGRADADVSASAIKEWLRVHLATCADVRTVVAAVGEAKAEAVAKAAGVSEAQIAKAKKCLR